MAPLPWDTLFPRQIELFNIGCEDDCKDKHPNSPVALLVDGPRKSSKTIGVCHRILRHLWETPQARVGLIVKTVGSATDGGVWLDLIDIVIPIWIEANFGFQYTTFDRDGNPGPKIDSKTRTIYFKVRNHFSGTSELRLLSIQHDHEVKAKLKGTRFSCMWFSELSNFKDQNVFRVSWQQLRMYHLKPWQHLWVGDTNPAEEGEDSWIYRLWYLRRLEIMNNQEEFGRSLRHIFFKLEDNLSISKDERSVLRALYADDPGEEAREFDGRWVKGHGNKGKHFADVFSESIHVIGGEDESIELHPNTDRLLTGWDLGGSVNHAAGIVEKRLVQSLDGSREWSVFSVLDSLKYIGEQLSVGELGIEMLAKMKALDAIYGKTFEWTHWSDESAMNVYRPSSNSFDYMEILVATRNEILLNGVPKPHGSVRIRVRLIRRLLRERRLFVAGQCKDVIEMLKECRTGSKASDVVAWDEHKHVFDWLSYVLFMECASELEAVAAEPTARKLTPMHVPLA